MSKTTKTCGYIFKRGKKEGEKCNRPSKGDLCGDHNTKKKEYSKKYYTKKNSKRKQITHRERVLRFKKCVITKLPTANYCLLRVKSIEEAAKLLYMQILGVGLIAWPEKYEELVNSKIEKDKTNKNIIPTKHYIEFTGPEESAKKKLTELLIDRDNIVVRLKQAKELCEIVEKRLEENEDK
jgi:hypothetical protein